MSDLFEAYDHDGDRLVVSPAEGDTFDDGQEPAPGSVYFGAGRSGVILSPLQIDDLIAYLRQFASGTPDASVLDSRRVEALRIASKYNAGAGPLSDRTLAYARFLLGEPVDS